MPFSVAIRPHRRIGEIDPLIYGHFIEHLGRCIYGGISDEGSPLADERGFRKDVLEAVRRIKAPIVRWPGGNFVSGYRFEDGIGPTEARPRRFDIAWQAEESNRFGTDEFIEWCRAAETEPYITVNTGSADEIEAARWVEYCNAATDTHYANLRRRYGHNEPFGVRYWSIGNEVYGGWQIGNVPVEAYANQVFQFAKCMKAVDPSIKLIAVGVGDDPDWNWELLKRAGEHFDYLSVHEYHGGDQYDLTVASGAYVEQNLAMWCAMAETAAAMQRREQPVAIAFDEWNIWYRAGHTTQYHENYALKDGLFACRVFHAMHRLCRHVTMANLAQLVNVLGAMWTTAEALVLTPIYHAFDLYVNHFGQVGVPVETVSERMTVEFGQRGKFTPRRVAFDVLDVSAALSRDYRTLTVGLLNLHPTDQLDLDVDLGVAAEPRARWTRLWAPDVMAVNDIQDPTRVTLADGEARVSGSAMPVSLPPHSATVYEVRLLEAADHRGA